MGFALSSMQLASSAFAAGGAIPSKHTGEGVDVSPALSWNDVPEGAKSLALVCHDPDAPLVTPGRYGYVHTQGVSDFGKPGYGGPMPPEGHGVHHYFFWLLALDAQLELPAGLGMWELLENVEPHVVGMNRLVGTYQRG